MFEVVRVADTVQIAPALFQQERLAVDVEVRKKYANRVLDGFGLVVAMQGVDGLDDATVYQGSGHACARALFRLVVFRPRPNEVLTGVVQEHLPGKGLRVSLGFFDDVFVPKMFLKQQTAYDEEQKMWYWDVNNSKGYFFTGAEIRFRVVEVKFDASASGQPTLDLAHAPFVVYGDVVAAGLGMVAWWS